MTSTAPLNDLAWIPFQPMFFAAPAFGVMVANMAYGTVVGSAGQDLYRMGQPLGPQFDHVFYVNGPCDVASNGFGSCTTAEGRPVYALFAPGLAQGPPQLGEMWGPLDDNTCQLYPGVPGFRIVGPADTLNHRVLVLRYPRTTAYARAITAWNDVGGFRAHPVTDSLGTHKYDGTDPPYPAHTFTLSTGNSGTMNGRMWNVRAGDVFAYECSDEVAGVHALAPDARHLDDALGTIKIWSWGVGAVRPIPPGWALCDGSSNAPPAANGSGMDLRGYFPVGVETRSGAAIPSYSDGAYANGATGGSKLITSVPTTISGSAVQVDIGTDNRPPWRAVTWIERVA